MLKNSVFLRVVAPTILVSVLLLASCTVVAVHLHGQQKLTARIFGENVRSHTVAHDLEVSLKDLQSVIERTRQNPSTAASQVEKLHVRIRETIVRGKKIADNDRERTLLTDIEDSFFRHEKAWQRVVRSPSAPGDSAASATADESCTETQARAAQLWDFDEREIEQSEAAHYRATDWMIWGLAAVGGVGSLAGILLGYAVARSLRQSIHRLSVRVRDAADRLGQDLPTITLADDGDLHHLHEQMQGVVHEIEQVVERLQQREREVLRAEQLAAVGQLAAGVAHELRNPLTSIRMLVHKNRKRAAEQGIPNDNLEIIEQEIRRMERSLQTFLDFARPPKPERRPTDLAELVDRTFTLVEGRARNQQVLLQLERSGEPDGVDADSDQIQQLLINVILNALDAMPRGGTLTVELAAACDDHVELRVLDTGAGIAADMLPQLFSPFVSSKETGLGLGLVVSRRIAEAHGGILSAYNRPEGGACFVLRLPAHAELAVG
jgi:two-component system, NtrC family, sensor histidine kinase HydH